MISWFWYMTHHEDRIYYLLYIPIRKRYIVGSILQFKTLTIALKSKKVWFCGSLADCHSSLFWQFSFLGGTRRNSTGSIDMMTTKEGLVLSSGSIFLERIGSVSFWRKNRVAIKKRGQTDNTNQFILSVWLLYCFLIWSFKNWNDILYNCVKVLEQLILLTLIATFAG